MTKIESGDENETASYTEGKERIKKVYKDKVMQLKDVDERSSFVILGKLDEYEENLNFYESLLKLL